ncbi:MAG TPA: WecB/TagA/CpsF family glycosyltransferase [Pseudoflavonifractor sp.]|nr:WecB/TagA/CpsF family glycosyltransferase [Pseudoflavonifractor sp.]
MRIDVLGVGVDSLTGGEAVARAAELAAGDKFSYAVTPNPEFILLAKKNAAFRAALNAADLVVADGIGVVKAAKILGRPLKAKVPGIDLAEGLCGALAKSGGRLFLLGAKPGVAQAAREKLREKYPGLTICGVHDGYFKEDGPVIEEIRASAADVVFVCLGAPRQELWMAQHGPETGARLMLGLGGSLDVFAGTVERAPEGWQRLGLEWLHRLLKEPRRIGRMAKLPLVLVDAAACRLRGK